VYTAKATIIKTAPTQVSLSQPPLTPAYPPIPLPQSSRKHRLITRSQCKPTLDLARSGRTGSPAARPKLARGNSRMAMHWKRSLETNCRSCAPEPCDRTSY
jgi:hypothetical protein